MRRTLVILVEGFLDAEFVKELARLYGFEVEEASFDDVYMRLRIPSEASVAMVVKYAEKGFAKAVSYLARLCLNVARSRDFAKSKREFATLLLADDDNNLERKARQFNEILQRHLEKPSVELRRFEEWRFSSVYLAKHLRSGVEVRIGIAFVECSLECQITKHVYRDYNAFCNKAACHRIVDDKPREERVRAAINLLQTLHQQRGEEWFRDLVKVLNALFSTTP